MYDHIAFIWGASLSYVHIENGYLDGSKTTWSFMEKGCEAFGLKA